jgi:hypothetical protein
MSRINSPLWCRVDVGVAKESERLRVRVRVAGQARRPKKGGLSAAEGRTAIERKSDVEVIVSAYPDESISGLDCLYSRYP